MLVKITDESLVKSLLDEGKIEEASPIVEYYRDELRLRLEREVDEGNLSSKKAKALEEYLKDEWMAVDFDSIVEQVEDLIRDYNK